MFVRGLVSPCPPDDTGIGVTERSLSERAFWHRYRAAGLPALRGCALVGALAAAGLALVPLHETVGSIGESQPSRATLRQSFVMLVACMLALLFVVLNRRPRQVLRRYGLLVTLPCLFISLGIGSACWLLVTQDPEQAGLLMLVCLLTCLAWHGLFRLRAWQASACSMVVSALGATGMLQSGVSSALALCACLLVLNLAAFAASVRFEARERDIHADARRLRQLGQRVGEAMRIAAEDRHHQARLLACAEHDLRQPLASMRMYLALMESRNPVHAISMHPVLLDCAQAMSDSIAGLSRRAHGAQGAEGWRSERPGAPVALRSVLGRLRSVYEPPATRLGITLRIRMRASATSDPHAPGDEHALWAVLSNLLSNALKAPRPNRGGWVLVSVGRRRQRLVVSVCDNGVGIDPAHHRQIFRTSVRLRPHETASTGVSDLGSGRGLGLAIARRALRSLPGSSLRVYSQPGAGSRFELILEDSGSGREALAWVGAHDQRAWASDRRGSSDRRNRTRSDVRPLRFNDRRLQGGDRRRHDGDRRRYGDKDAAGAAGHRTRGELTPAS